MTRPVKIILIAASVAGIALLVILVALPRIYAPYIKRIVIETLEEKLNSKVEIRTLVIVPFPRVYVQAEGVVLRQNGRTDVPPLMSFERVNISASLLQLLGRQIRVSSVHLAGLQIHVPPRDETPQPEQPRKKFAPNVLIDEITSEDALLETLPRDPQKAPRDFLIHQVIMHAFSFEHPAPFHALLTNPAPEGEIHSDGQFGPWNAQEPGDTPVTGAFTFSNADLGTLRGISGTLSSTGNYRGTLDALDVEGDTDTPDFALNIGGNTVPLRTHYVAVVDGTNGNTHLTSVDAVLGTTTIHCTGEVVGKKGVHGRLISIQAEAKDGKIEDLLRLAVKGNKPLMKGSVNLHANMEIPPEEGKDVLDRLKLDGQFLIAGAHFTSEDTQEKLDSLSRRSQGQPGDEDIQDVISNLRGRFVMRRGAITFSNLSFKVPGAAVQLAGSYNLRSEQIDFHGHLLMDAKLSQTVKGAKSIFLKFVDPFFSKDGGGSSIPIKVVGDRSHPDFGLDLHHKSDERDAKGVKRAEK